MCVCVQKLVVGSSLGRVGVRWIICLRTSYRHLCSVLTVVCTGVCMQCLVVGCYQFFSYLYLFCVLFLRMYSFLIQCFKLFVKVLINAF